MNKKHFPLFYVGFVLFLFLLGAAAMSSSRGYVYGQGWDAAGDWGLLLIILGILFGYIIPSVIAVSRMNPNLGPIVILNLALGWTFLGWLGALMWSLSSVSERA